MITSAAWSGKRYVVLGLARSGKATAEALLASGADVLVWDDRAETREAFAGRATIADPLEADLSGYSGVVVSPGVPLNTHPIAGHAAKYAVPVIGDIELFAQARADLPPHQVVGITGTNGKSTTTALTHHILKTAGVPTTMGGNIGLPILEQDPLPEGGVYVLELSSYQIDLTTSLDCDVAVLLNITPDHLDRYESFEDYAASKARLFAMQDKGRVAIIAVQNNSARLVAQELFQQREPIMVGSNHGEVYASDNDLLWWQEKLGPQSDWLNLQGEHNAKNVACASAACWATGYVSHQQAAQGLKTFSGLPHRMERVADSGGVAWINDSKGTNTAATAPALAAFDNIHWIVGGLAKEPGPNQTLLGECEAQLGHVKAAYTIGKSGEDFARLLETRVPTKRAVTLEQAVASAANSVRPGDTVLLSPACASFDQFRDFEHRGEVFKTAVEELKDAPEKPEGAAK